MRLHTMRRTGTAVLLAALVALASAACGPAQCYDGCTDARPLVDFMILVDSSGSMSPWKTGIVNGLNAWAQSLSDVNAAYAIVTFGTKNTEPKIVQQITTNFATFKTTLANGIHLGGAWEAGFEAIRCVAGTANTNNLNINWRPDASRVLILLTDEDSDPAMYPANRVQSASTTSNLCRTAKHFGQNPPYYISVMSPSVWATYEQETNLAVQAIKTAKFKHVYMLVKPTVTGATCNTFSQYGNPAKQVQHADFSNFDATQTLNKCLADTDESAASLQAKLLSSTPPILARVFDIAQASNPNFVNNFFAAVTADVNQCDPCMDYDCSGNQCMDPVNICDCNGVPNGPAVVDCNGVCGGTSVRDCAGVCGGNAKYDECGICTADGVLSQFCKEDCANNRYISSRPSAAMLTDCSKVPSWFSSYAAKAGYIVANSDLKSAGTAGKWTAEEICHHFRAYGQFEDRNTCEFDVDFYVSNNAAFKGGAGAAAEHYVREGLRAGANARCKPETTTKLPPRTKDNCGQCIANPLTPPFCRRDCTGWWRTSEADMHVIDACGVCNGNNATLDDCGVCNGGNKAKDPCGVCFGIFGVDGCDNYLCDPNRPECTKDCNGDPYTVGQNPDHQNDECGQCVEFGQRHPNCVQDCGRVWFLNGTEDPSFTLDPCGNCLPHGQIADTCVQDCAGKYDGDGYYDECGQCIATHELAPKTVECLFDCNRTAYLATESPKNVVDDCNVCVDVADPAAYNALKDNCNVCTNLLGYDSATECVQDCDGEWRNVTDVTRPVVDVCGDCIPANNMSLFNRRRNACGTCVDEADLNDPVKWYDGQQQDTDGEWCSCGVAPMDCEDGGTSCVDCPPPNTCPDGSQKDECGHCPEDDMYGRKDKCGICCGNYGNITGVQCDQDVDDCGVCFGGNANKTTNLCNVCDPKDCPLDCAGVPYGTAVPDCAGVCGGDSICAVCGNNIVEDGEACDDGAANGSGGCTTECTIVSGALTGGQIAGAVIGAIAAVALVAALALFGWRYAVSNGLFGAAKSKVDMGASNSNPLYESETKVASNPLYNGD